MTNMIKTTALKPHLGPDGKFIQVGDPIEVDEHRHRQLAKKGYVPKLTDQAEVDGPRQRTTGVITNADFAPRRDPVVTPAEPKRLPESQEQAAPVSIGKGRKAADTRAQ